MPDLTMFMSPILQKVKAADGKFFRQPPFVNRPRIYPVRQKDFYAAIIFLF